MVVASSRRSSPGPSLCVSDYTWKSWGALFGRLLLGSLKKELAVLLEVKNHGTKEGSFISKELDSGLCY